MWVIVCQSGTFSFFEFIDCKAYWLYFASGESREGCGGGGWSVGELELGIYTLYYCGILKLVEFNNSFGFSLSWPSHGSRLCNIIYQTSKMFLRLAVLKNDTLVSIINKYVRSVDKILQIFLKCVSYLTILHHPQSTSYVDLLFFSCHYNNILYFNTDRSKS